jgi:hypothetical protein
VRHFGCHANRFTQRRVRMDDGHSERYDCRFHHFTL